MSLGEVVMDISGHFFDDECDRFSSIQVFTPQVS